MALMEAVWPSVQRMGLAIRNHSGHLVDSLSVVPSLNP